MHRDFQFSLRGLDSECIPVEIKEMTSYLHYLRTNANHFYIEGDFVLKPNKTILRKCNCFETVWQNLKNLLPRVKPKPSSNLTIKVIDFKSLKLIKGEAVCPMDEQFAVQK
ncbi:hypothetical protein COCON_G00079980 [Conger conger]|uniref:Uncharacterized protein n=1 Tax=Conger conger TaxID=82655 RepID=A0A9Q1I1U7_CONCO|nr:hypothetical protein COCON_G00079980 [Conger conger]